jgi:CRISPR-associated protein Cmx8
MTAAERPPDRQADLPRRVHDMVRAYIAFRTEARSNTRRDSIPLVVDPTTGNQRRRYPPEYIEANNRFCEAAFLAMRSRRSRQDFVDYFTSTICAAPQFLPDVDYRALADALLRDDAWEEVKALAMLTISSLYIRTGGNP